jgi:hypothetical protein
MPWRMVGKGGQALIVLVALGLAAALGYEFYAPIVGQIAAGDEQEAQPAVPRNRALVKVEAYMARQPGITLPTLMDTARFYGLEDDTLECAVQENYGEAARPAAVPVLSNRPVQIGEEIILCLD